MDTIEARVAEGRKRRVWSDDEKRPICAQTRVPGVSVSQVARRYNANTNLVFTWLRDPRFAPTSQRGTRRGSCPSRSSGARRLSERCSPESRIEMSWRAATGCGSPARYDPDALARLIRGLSA